jgi:hypothetical protein
MIEDIFTAVSIGLMSFCVFGICVSVRGLLEEREVRKYADVRSFDEFLRGHR